MQSRPGGDAWKTKVRVGISHAEWDGGWWECYRKQRRWIQDYRFRKQVNSRKFEWGSVGIRSGSRFGLVRFIMLTVLVVPLLIQMLRVLLSKPGSARRCHVSACWITPVAYTLGPFKGIFVQREASRSGWR